MDQQEKYRFNVLTRELCRNITREKIVQIAKQNGWEIRRAGREPLKAFRQGYSSVSIPGHNNNAVIPYDTASKIIKLLLKPSFNKELQKVNDKAWVEAYNHDLNIQRDRADKAERQLEKLNFMIVRSKDDAEAGLELSAETENKNRVIGKELYRYTCWLKALKQKIADLMLQRRKQEAEMLEIANAVEQQELRILYSAKMLEQLSIKLKPALRQELKQVVQYLTEQST